MAPAAYRREQRERRASRRAYRCRDDGQSEECVYIVRRDTDSALNRWAGGRLLPGVHGRAAFTVGDHGETVHLSMRAADGVGVDLRARAAATLHSDVFASLDDASRFFRTGALGYSAKAERSRLDGLYLDTPSWRVDPLEVELVRSSYFEDPARFPPGSVVLDCALIMRDTVHEWRRAAEVRLD